MTSEQQLAKLQREYGTALFHQNWVSHDWPYWDKVGYATAGANSYSFFAVPAGGLDPNSGLQKTNEDCNFVNQNQIGGGECFIATHLMLDIKLAPKARQTGTGVSSDTNFSARQLPYARFVDQLSYQGVLTWTIQQKKWLIEDNPFHRFPPGWGLSESTRPPAIGTADGVTAINSGANAYMALSQFQGDDGNVGDPFSLAQPVFLAPNTPFEITLSSVTGNFLAATNLMGASANQVAILQLVCVMKGWKVRPRQ